MSQEYSSNIDDQLLNVAKQTTSNLDLGEHQPPMGSSSLETPIAPRPSSAPSSAHPQQFHQHHLGGHQEFHYDESEYGLHLPEPIINQKQKIFPVSETTITEDGNLITRPYPEQSFTNRAQLNEFIQEFARDNGFGVVIAHSNKKAIYYTCELGGRYRHKKQKKDENVPEGNFLLDDDSSKTKKLRCPFAMTASYKKSTGVWTVRTTCNEHNHPQLDPLSNHPMLRKRSEQLNGMILDLYKVGTKPSAIETRIKEQFPDVLIKREDIYNEIRGYKRKLKKHSQRFIDGSRKKTTATSSEEEAAAAVAAAANAFLEGDSHHWNMSSHHQQQQQDEFQRQLQEAGVSGAHPHIDDNDARFYSDYNDGSGSIGSENPELSMDNIDSRLVNEEV
ncbi:hypothetical protein DIURU_005813 [Diutina rugosa]|uniref:FAR1 domain-containing protein n=1 Tax=Diutina rugosa TaxID=5481 RepID=A0A642UBZ4_DIURU|nr:uncharacterized protein DIURU_005813 [Diutina rugosa]KAA8896441.1 hypothetical protein DIURU_005813 [Diutina rugosa]